MLESSLWDYSVAYIFLSGTRQLNEDQQTKQQDKHIKELKENFLKNFHHLQTIYTK